MLAQLLLLCILFVQIQKNGDISKKSLLIQVNNINQEATIVKENRFMLNDCCWTFELNTHTHTLSVQVKMYKSLFYCQYLDRQ